MSTCGTPTLRSRERTNWREGREKPSGNIPGFRDAFHAYCSFGGGSGEAINTKLWAKLVTDTGILDRSFDMTSADITFTKVAGTNKQLGFDDFIWLVDLAAEAKGVPFESVARQVASNGPSSSGTVADSVRFHDDKSMYTGAYAAQQGMEAKVREHKSWKEDRSVPRSIPGMENVFDNFCTFAGGKAGAMGNATWTKLCQDCELYDRRFNSNAADVVFTKVCGTNKTVGYLDYKWLLDLARRYISAEEKGVDYESMCARIINVGGPHSSGTKADNVRFHDDESSYTGMHKR